MWNDLVVAEARSRSDVSNQTLLECFSLFFNLVVLCANVGRKNNDDGVTNAEQHNPIEMEATSSKKISGWTVIDVESATGADKVIVNGIGERCLIDNVVANVPERLFLNLFAASRSS